jgi:uncharacterized membrane protein YkvA (DUF1232 family)
MQQQVRHTMKKLTGTKRRFGFREEIFVLYYAVSDKRTPIFAKLFAGISLIYLISPIDLVPDFIPVAGFLDDLIIVPLLLHIAFLLLPAEVKESGWSKAGKHVVRLRIAFFVIILAILALLTGIFFAVKALLQHLG